MIQQNRADVMKNILKNFCTSASHFLPVNNELPLSMVHLKSRNEAP